MFPYGYDFYAGLVAKSMGMMKQAQLSGIPEIEFCVLSCLLMGKMRTARLPFRALSLGRALYQSQLF